MAGDMTFLGDGRLMVDIHETSQRSPERGRGCWVHRASDWALRSAPVFWDESERRAYRQCVHGAFHRDLDDYAYQTRHSTKYSGMPPWCCPDDADCARCRSGLDEAPR